MALHHTHRSGSNSRMEATPSSEPLSPSQSYNRFAYSTSTSNERSVASADLATIPFSTGAVGTALSEAETMTSPSREPITSISPSVTAALACGSSEAAVAYLRASVASTRLAGAGSPCLEAVPEAGRLGWLSAIALILATVLGGGVLVLPGAVARLGWRAGYLTLVFFYCMSFFVAYLLHKLHMIYRYPLARSIGDICANVFGLRGGCVAWGVLYLTLFQFLANYLVDVERLIHGWVLECGASYQGPLQSSRSRIVVAAALLAPASQVRSLWRLAPLAVLSVLSAVVVLTLYLAAVFQGTNGSGCDRQDSQPEVIDAFDVSTTMSQITFAFTGQIIFLEIQAEMSEPASFWISVQMAYLVLLVISLGIATISLWKCGENTPSQVSSAIEAVHNNGALLLSNVLLVVHFVASYSIAQQVLAHEIAVWILPSAMDKGAKARLQWLVLTAAQLLLAAALVLWLPDETGVLDCLAALASTLSFGFPCVLYLASRRHQQVLNDRRSDQVAAVACGVMLLTVAALAVADGMAVGRHKYLPHQVPTPQRLQ